MIRTGFKELDNLIDLNKPGITVITGIGNADILSRRYCQQYMFETDIYPLNSEMKSKFEKENRRY